MKRITDLLVVLHFFCLFTPAAGLIIAIIWPRYAEAQAIYCIIIPGLWGLWGGCPLTVIEQQLRLRHHPQGYYDGPFIPHYSKKWFGFTIPDYVTNTVMGCILAFSVALYCLNQ